MITLALDTSTATGSLALLRDDEPQVERTFQRGELFPALQAMKVELRAVDLFAVGLGPGSFTGIRAGIAAGKGLALPLNRLIKGASSFDALALTARAQMPRECPQMVVLGDARREEIYYAVYDREGRVVRGCRIASLEALADEVHNPLWFVSSEIDRYRDDLKSLLGGFAVVADQPVYPSAIAVGWLARQGGTEQLDPIYLRETNYRRSN